MPTEWTEEQINEGGKSSLSKWTHGLLLPVESQYMRWKREGEEKSTEISYEEYKALGDGEGGERVIFHIDPTVVNPSLQFTVDRGVFRDYPDWRRLVAPQVKDLTGISKEKEALKEFASRARTKEWYIEAELVVIKTTKGEKEFSNEVPRFTRWTQDLETIKQWNKERYANPIPDPTAEQIEVAKLYLVRSKGDLARFESFVNDDDGIKRVAPKLIAMANAGELS